jgi:hypothetical protein
MVVGFYRAWTRLRPERSTGTNHISISYLLDKAVHQEDKMTKLLAGVSLLLLVVGASAPAQAKGCIKGAMVGGAAGHMAGHHGTIGALAGCAIGHHEANKQAQTNQPQSGAGKPAQQ